jgi:hypothetical protein
MRISRELGALLQVETGGSEVEEQAATCENLTNSVSLDFC